MTEDATPVQADVPVADKPKAKKEPKERKPRTPKDPFDFGQPTEADPKYKLPAELPKDKTGLRAVAQKAGIVPVLALSYLNTREAHAALREDYPFVTRPAAYGYDPGVAEVKVKNLGELLKIAGERKKAYTELEKVRSAEREAQRREALGDMAEKYSGRTRESRVTFLKETLSALAPWAPVDAQPVRAEERVYDIDGMAGRRQFVRIVPVDQIKQDGNPKANAVVKQMSPQVFHELIEGDKELEALFQLPEGFLVAPKKEPKAPKADGDKPKRRRRSTRDALAAADAAAGVEGAEPVEEPGEDLDAIGGDTPAEVPVTTSPEIPQL